MIKEIEGLSIREMTYIGVCLLKKYCVKNNIYNSEVDEFCFSMLNILTAEDIPEWDKNCNEIEINGLGDVLPNNFISEYPQYADKIDKITQNIREISASQMYGKWIPEESYKFLIQVEVLTNIKVITLKSLLLLKSIITKVVDLDYQLNKTL
ncbi:hypothetical protein [Aureivirga sp. CE67]|uniref:hypothetical protein n=1 Tax=Aureivirga sp. CE67 TaxID=1788983 RepID=UPI0018CAFD08|nr:hypothetical protein [Aureivirga sp. CE67]